VVSSKIVWLGPVLKCLDLSISADYGCADVVVVTFYCYQCFCYYKKSVVVVDKVIKNFTSWLFLL